MKNIIKTVIFLGCLHTTAFSQVVFQGAQWINDSTKVSCPVYTKSIPLQKEITAATLYITAHGLYEATINNKRVGDAWFTPGFTSYNIRLQYQQYDVRDLLKKGSNDISVAVGEGWYRGIFGGNMASHIYAAKKRQQ